ncbi:MAG: hypothetical protein WD557_09045 [Dehalococcoidia bacterium]
MFSTPSAINRERQESERPPAGEGGRTILRSYLLMRAVVGLLGVLLTPLLFLGEYWIDASLATRGSLSAYYHTGMRDIFVGILVTVGISLVAYKFFDWRLENLFTGIAGVAVIVVALFPTTLPNDGSAPITPLQDRLGEGEVAAVHYIAAFTFLGLLAIVSWFFGAREGERKGRPQMLSESLPHPGPDKRKWFHYWCALAVTGAVVYLFVTRFIVDFSEDYDLLVGEIVALTAFGLSWIYKGLELDLLFGPRAMAQAQPSPAPQPPAPQPPSPAPSP